MNTDENIKKWKSYNHIYFLQQKNSLRYLFIFLLIGFIVLLFSPWTQNISSKGYVTAFNINERNYFGHGPCRKWKINFLQMNKRIITNI